MILDTLSNGLKDLFAALGAKTSDSNYAVPLLNKTNGTPQGMMDMASLASVLGVNSKVGKMPIPEYSAALPGNQWVAFSASAGNIEGQPFQWGSYFSLGAIQFAVKSNAFACRWIEAGSNTYSNWLVFEKAT